jgi:hypothetical protein
MHVLLHQKIDIVAVNSCLEVLILWKKSSNICLSILLTEKATIHFVLIQEEVQGVGWMGINQYNLPDGDSNLKQPRSQPTQIPAKPDKHLTELIFYKGSVFSLYSVNNPHIAFLFRLKKYIYCPGISGHETSQLY